MTLFRAAQNTVKLKALGMALLLFLMTSFAFASMTGVSQDGARQVVNMKREWARNHFIKREAGKELVFFMGNSKIAAGLVPEVFDQATGGMTHSYNLALPGLPLAPHYFLLADYLKTHPPPDMIILRLNKGGWNYFHFSEYAIQGAGIFEVLGYRKVIGNNDLFINYFLSPRLNWPFVKRFVLGKLYSFLPKDLQLRIRSAYEAEQVDREYYEHDWDYFFEAQFIRPEDRARERRQFVADHRGYYNFRENAVVGGALPKDYAYVKKGDWAQSDYAGEEDPFVDKFFKLAESLGIRVMLINSYVLETEKGDAMPRLWTDLASRYRNVILPEESARPQVMANQFFSDPLHLNQKGADLYSRYIASVFLRAVHSRTSP